jgi:hypothetical protein
MAVSTTVLCEIRSFPAGPQLDRLIAHEVMGVPTTAEVPAYSTEMAMAWPVVEALVRRENLYFGAPHYKNKRQSLAQLGYPEGTDCWYCVVNSKALNKVVVCADTAALAICRAALLCARSTS